MATLTTSPQVIGEHGGTQHTRLYAWYSDVSGNSCIVHFRLTVVYEGITYTGTNKKRQLAYDGYNSGTIDYGDAPLNANTEYTVMEGARWYDGGSTVNASALYWSYVYGSSDIGNSQATVPSFYIKPSTPSVSVANADSYANNVTYGTSSFGNPASGTVYLYGGTSNNPTTQIAAKNTTGNSVFKHTGLMPGTKYYYRARVYNGQGWSDYSSVKSITTPYVAPTKPTVSVEIVNAHTIKIKYGTSSFGVPNSGTVKLYGGTSSTPTTELTSKTTTGETTYTFTNLTGNTTYFFRARANNGQLDSEYSDTISITTPYTNYVADENDEATLVLKYLVSQNGLSKDVKKLYDSNNGVSRRFW